MIKFNKFVFCFLMPLLCLVCCNKDKESSLNFEANFIGNWELKSIQSLFNSDTLIQSYVDNYNCLIIDGHTLISKKLHYKFDTLYWLYRKNENKILIIADYLGAENQLYRDMDILTNDQNYIEFESKTRYFSFDKRLIDLTLQYQFTRVK